MIEREADPPLGKWRKIRDTETTERRQRSPRFQGAGRETATRWAPRGGAGNVPVGYLGSRAFGGPEMQKIPSLHSDSVTSRVGRALT